MVFGLEQSTVYIKVWKNTDCTYLYKCIYIGVYVYL